MSPDFLTAPPRLHATTILHQEGLFALLAFLAIFLRQGDVLSALAPAGPILISVGMGVAVGLLLSLVDLLLSGAPLFRDLESFQSEMIAGWSLQDVFAVSLLSGIAEEALMRAFLLPWIGLIPSALCFALLHIVPDRRLWLWPVMAFAMGLLLGLLFLKWGYPACATAHILINALSFLRLLRVRKAASSA